MRYHPKNLCLTVCLAGLTVFLLLLAGFFFPQEWLAVGWTQGIQELEVSFIDVGQGDSSLLNLPGQTAILIDGGPKSAGASVLNYLQQEGITDLDLVVMSHQHKDHIGGLIEILQSDIQIDEVIFNGNDCITITCQELWMVMGNRGLTPVPVVEGDSFQLSSLSVKILNPFDPPTGDENNDSVVMEVGFELVDLLFTGDIEAVIEEALLGKGRLDETDVLKVAHHGSETSTIRAFVEIVKPLFAIISVGESNPYHHPSLTIIERLEEAGGVVFRTDQDGTVKFFTDGVTWRKAPSQLFFPVFFYQETHPLSN